MRIWRPKDPSFLPGKKFVPAGAVLVDSTPDTSATSGRKQELIKQTWNFGSGAFFVFHSRHSPSPRPARDSVPLTELGGNPVASV